MNYKEEIAVVGLTILLLIGISWFALESIRPGIDEPNISKENSTGFLFFNSTELFPSPTITISSTYENSTDLLPPYHVRMSKEECRPIRCKEGSDFYCYICDKLEGKK